MLGSGFPISLSRLFLIALSLAALTALIFSARSSREPSKPGPTTALLTAPQNQHLPQPSAHAFPLSTPVAPAAEPSVLLHVTRLVTADLDAALAYTRKLPDTAQREACYETIAVELSRSEPLQAIEIAASNLPSLRAHSTIAHAARNWAARSASEVALWAVELESETLRETVLRAIAPELASIDPASASEIMNATTVGQARLQTLALILQRWEKHDPNAAKIWRHHLEQSYITQTE